MSHRPEIKISLKLVGENMENFLIVKKHLEIKSNDAVVLQLINSTAKIAQGLFEVPPEPTNLDEHDGPVFFRGKEIKGKALEEIKETMASAIAPIEEPEPVVVPAPDIPTMVITKSAKPEPQKEPELKPKITKEDLAPNVAPVRDPPLPIPDIPEPIPEPEPLTKVKPSSKVKASLSPKPKAQPHDGDELTTEELAEMVEKAKPEGPQPKVTRIPPDPDPE